MKMQFHRRSSRLLPFESYLCHHHSYGLCFSDILTSMTVSIERHAGGPSHRNASGRRRLYILVILGQHVIICILDALDECRDSELRTLLRKICDFYETCPKGIALKFLATSRPLQHIENHFSDLSQKIPEIRQ